jgi:hypothetical protein
MHVHYQDPCCQTKAVLHGVSMSMLHVHVQPACPCPCRMSMSMLHVHVKVHVHLYRNAGMPDCLAAGQSESGIWLRKTYDAGTGSVPD